MALNESKEMYLESILIVSKSLKKVRAIDIVEHMGFSKPSVSRALGLLKQEKLITVERAAITLTEEGRVLAEQTYERHLLLTQVLESLGVSPDIASADACRIEHYISEETFRAIKDYINQQNS